MEPHPSVEGVTFEAVKDQLVLLGQDIPDDVIRAFLRDGSIYFGDQPEAAAPDPLSESDADQDNITTDKAIDFSTLQISSPDCFAGDPTMSAPEFKDLAVNSRVSAESNLLPGNPTSQPNDDLMRKEAMCALGAATEGTTRTSASENEQTILDERDLVEVAQPSNAEAGGQASARISDLDTPHDVSAISITSPQYI
jgi:hypothetical protein